MKRLFLAAALAVSMAGCANKLPSQTPAQVADQVCPVVKTTLASLSALQLGLSAATDLGKATLAADAVCTVGKAVTAGNLQDLSGQAFPAMISIVQSAGLATDEQSRIVLGLSAAQIVLSGFFALNPQLTSIGTGLAVPATTAAK